MQGGLLLCAQERQPAEDRRTISGPFSFALLQAQSGCRSLTPTACLSPGVKQLTSLHR